MGVRTQKASNISFLCRLCMRRTWAEYETCIFLGSDSWWEVWSRAQKCTCLQTGTRVRALRTILWEHGVQMRHIHEQKAWKLQMSCIDSNLWSDWGPGAENLATTPFRLEGMGAGKAELSSFYQRRGHPSKAPCPPPGVWMRYCKSRLTDGEHDEWAAALGKVKWTRFSSSLVSSRKLLLTSFSYLCS